MHAIMSKVAVGGMAVALAFSMAACSAGKDAAQDKDAGHGQQTTQKVEVNDARPTWTPVSFAELTNSQKNAAVEVTGKVEAVEEMDTNGTTLTFMAISMDGGEAIVAAYKSYLNGVVPAIGSQITVDGYYMGVQELKKGVSGPFVKFDQYVGDISTTNVGEPDGAAVSVPTEHKNALEKARQYNKLMHMSKQRLYEQLTSEHGEKFSEEAAQYAVDNLDADYKANALAKAKDYESHMAMSPSAIYDQLVSEYGEKFTEDEAQYAIDNL